MNLSLDDVAAVSGLKKEELEDIENGSKEISIAILGKLSYVYGMSHIRNAKIIMFNFSNESMYKKKKKS